MVLSVFTQVCMVGCVGIHNKMEGHDIPRYIHFHC